MDGLEEGPGVGGYEGEGGGEEITPSWEANDDDYFVPEPGAPPVKWSEYRQMSVPKSELTRMRQEDSTRFQQELNQYRQQLAASYQDAYQRAMAVQQTQGRQGQQQGQPTRNKIEQILAAADEHQGWVNKDVLMQLVQHFEQELGQRDQLSQRQMAALEMMYGQQQKLAPAMSSLMSNAQQGKLRTAMDSLFTRHEIDAEDRPAAEAVIMDIIDSHEPGTVDFQKHLPQMFGERWAQLEKVFHRRSKAMALRNRGIPGRGGQASPSLPLSDAGLSDQELAKKAWEAIQAAPQS